MSAVPQYYRPTSYGATARRAATPAVAALAAVTVTWGAFAFGAVYPWAFTILAGLCAMTGLIGLRVGYRSLTLARHVFVALSLVSLVGLLQLIPLPQSWLAVISPATDRFLRAYDLTYSHGTQLGADGEPTVVAVRHALSLQPAATVRALFLLAAFALLLAGLLRALSRDVAIALARSMVYVGAVLAVFGVVQKAILGESAYTGMKIYGFWTPRYVLTTPFGPYVNKNHFAGWMLMVIPLAFGLTMGAVERNRAEIGSGFRGVLLWLSGPKGGRTLMLAFAGLLMTFSLIVTRSRSGLVAFVALALISGVFVARRSGSRKQGIALIGGFLLLILVALFWAGAETAVGRFATESDSVQLRLRIWRVAAAIVRDFPVIGTGLDTFGVATLRYQPATDPLHYQEAHNDYLQLLTEGGMVLAAIVIFAIIAIARDIRARFATDDHPQLYWLRAGAVLGLVGIALQSAVEFSLQMPGNAAAFTVLLALALRLPSPRRSA